MKVSFYLMFKICTETMEVEIAGSVDERNALMPLLYLDSHREKAELES